jgi:hypothetical protein
MAADDAETRAIRGYLSALSLDRPIAAVYCPPKSIKFAKNKKNPSAGGGSMRRTLVASILGLSLSLMTCGTAWPQATAQISGTVRDQSGAVLPGVQITGTQTATGVERSAITNETGSYLMSNLALGPYRLEAALPGFRTFAQTGIVLQVNSNPTINVVLDVGQITEQVEVQANASLVETKSVGIGRIMETERIVELPLNGRNPSELILLAGATAVVGTGGALAGSATFPGRLMISSAGTLGPNTDYFLDGMRHVDTHDGLGMPMPFPDALAEFKTESSGLNAQQSHSTVVSAVTKSGTNGFHGDLFEFVRNDLFNARNYFATKNSTLKRNQFGGTIGGPIVKNKLFFFAGYQGTTLRQDPNDVRQFVPTAAMLTGDFTTFASPACNANKVINLKAPFANNRIDPDLFSPAALKIAARLPKTDDGCGEVKFGRVSNDDRKEFVAKIDYQKNEKHSLFGRILWDIDDVPSPFAYTPDIVMNAANGTHSFSKAIALGSTYLINPTTVNSFRLSYSGQRNIRKTPSNFAPKDVGINAYSFYPNINVSVNAGFSIPFSTGDFRTHLYQISDDLNMTRGRHQFGVGLYIGHARVYKITDQPAIFGFTGATTGLGMADFLTGKMSDLNQGNPSEGFSRLNYRGVYGQDSWQVARRLTLTYGVRWNPLLPIADMKRPIPIVANFDLDRYRQGIRSTVFVNAPPGMVYIGDRGFVQNNNGLDAAKPRADLYDAHWFTFAPRAGLSWDVEGNGRTSVRASYGLNYEDPFAVSRQGSQLGQAPWGVAVRLVAPPGGLDDPWRGIPGGNPFPLGLKRDMAFPSRGDYMPLRADIVPLYTQSWNLSLQREVVPGTLVSASYLGTLLIHTQAVDPINQPVFVPGTGDASGNCFLNGKTVHFKVAPAAACSTLGNTQERRKLSFENPAFAETIGRMGTIINGGTQNYHGMLLSLQRRPSNGINLNANYTWSHCIGDYGGRANDGNGPNVIHTYTDTTNRRRDRANCETDQRHIFNLTAVAETPQFANRTLRFIGGGWRLSGLYRAFSSSYSSGFRTVALSDPPGPQETAAGMDPCLCDVVGQRPNLILADIYKDKSGRPNTQYLNSAAFAIPAAGTLGNAGRGIVKLPYAWQFDLALARVFHFREAQSLEFRLEGYNVTNSFRPGNINLNLTSNQFGQIRTSLEPRVMQFAVKYMF